MNAPTPWTDKFLSSSLEAHSKFFGWAEKNPKLFLGAGAATLLAPLFLKNDERGYVDTALITTPLITAAAMVAPRVFPTFIREKASVFNVVRNVKEDYGFNANPNIISGREEISIKESLQALKEGRLSPKTYNRRLIKWMEDAPVREATEKEIEQEFLAAQKGFSKLYANQSKHRLLSNAIYHTELKTFSTADKVEMGAAGMLTKTAPDVDEGFGLSIIGNHQKDVPWLREFNFRLKQAKDTKVFESVETLIPVRNSVFGEKLSEALGTSYKPPTDSLLSSPKPISAKVISYREGIEQFKINNSHNAGLLEQYINKKQIKGKDVKFITHPGIFKPSEEDLLDLEKFSGGQTEYYHANKATWRGPKSNRPFDPIIGIRLNKEMTVPVPINNQAYLGENLLQKGVARSVLEQDGEMSSVEYLLKSYFTEGVEVAKSRISEVNHWLGRDTLQSSWGKVLGSYVQDADEVAARVKGFQRVMSELPDSFKNAKGEGSAWSGLRKGEQTEILRTLSDTGKITRSSGGTTLSVYESKEAVNLGFFGTPGTTEDLVFKAAKGGNHTLVKTGKEAGLVNDFLDITRVKMQHYQVPQAQAAFFSELPTWKVLSQGLSKDLRGKDRTTVIGNVLETMGIRSRMIKHLSADAGVDLTVGEEMFNKFLPSISRRKSYEAIRKLGTLGDVSKVIPRNFGATFFENIGMTVSEPSLTEAAIGKTLPEGTLIGFENGTLRSTKGESVLQSINKGTGGETHYAFTRTGSSQEVKGIGDVKWTPGAVLEDEEVPLVRDILNKFRKSTNQWGQIPKESDAYILEQKGLTAAKNPIQAQLNQTQRILERLQDANTGELPSFIKENFLPKFSSYGINWNAKEKSLHYNPLVLPTDELRSIGAVETNDLITRMFREVGERLRSHTVNADVFLQKWASVSKTHPDVSLQEYVSTLNYTTADALVENTGFNVGTRVKFTHDASSMLQSMGLHDIAKEIQSRSCVEGNLSQATDYLKHTAPINFDPKKPVVYDWSKPYGKVINIEDVDEDVLGRLSTSDGRLGTIFDPDLMKDNFSFRVKNKVGEDRYVPYLGHDAYKGGVNEYGIGSYALSDSEKDVKKFIIDAVETGDWEESATIMQNNLRSRLGVGKGSVYRPELYDPFGIAGKITPRPSTWRDAKTGELIGHEVAVGKELLSGLPRGLQEDLLAGGHTFSITQRFPINTSSVTRLVHDPRLNGTSKIGTSLDVMSNLLGDPDGDPIQTHIMLDLEHRKRLERTILDQNSEQSKFTSLRRKTLGSEMEIIPPTGVSYAKHRSTPEKMAEKVSSFANVDRTKALINRSSSEAVGAFDNLKTTLETLLTHAPEHLIPVAEKQDIRFSNFLSLTQAAIYRQKRVGEEAYDMTKAYTSIRAVKTSLGKRGGAESFEKAMRGFVSAFESEGVNPVAEHFEQLASKGYIKALHASAFEPGNEGVIKAAELMTMSGVKRDAFVGDAVESMERYFPGSAALSHRGAEMGAEAIGGLNDAVRSTEQKVREAATGVINSTFRSAERVVEAGKSSKAGKVLAIGLGVAAAAGIMFSSLHSPREGGALAGSLRPEVAMGTDGGVPGEPVEGSMSPGNPPRAVHAPKQGVMTSVVAPMGRDTDLEMTLKAENRDRATEVAKMASKLASQGGPSSVNINYRDSTKLKSLRTRQKIKDAMGEE